MWKLYQRETPFNSYSFNAHFVYHRQIAIINYELLITNGQGKAFVSDTKPTLSVHWLQIGIRHTVAIHNKLQCIRKLKNNCDKKWNVKPNYTFHRANKKYETDAVNIKTIITE